MNVLEHPDTTYVNNNGYLNEDKPIGECEACGGEIYDGGLGYNIPNIPLHDECLSIYFAQYKCVMVEGIL